MGINIRGFQKLAARHMNTLGKKLNSDQMKTLGRKVKNTVRDIAGHVAPIADGVSTVAAMAGHPEIAGTAAMVGAAAKRLR